MLIETKEEKASKGLQDAYVKTQLDVPMEFKKLIAEEVDDLGIDVGELVTTMMCAYYNIDRQVLPYQARPKQPLSVKWQKGGDCKITVHIPVKLRNYMAAQRIMRRRTIREQFVEGICMYFGIPEPKRSKRTWWEARPGLKQPEAPPPEQEKDLVIDARTRVIRYETIRCATCGENFQAPVPRWIEVRNCPAHRTNAARREYERTKVRECPKCGKEFTLEGDRLQNWGAKTVCRDCWLKPKKTKVE